MWVVDLDLGKFFERVKHDKLMGLLAKTIEDKVLLRLIRSYLNAGIMIEGVRSEVRREHLKVFPSVPFSRILC